MMFLVPPESYLALPAAWRGLGEALEGPHGKETSGTHLWLPKLQPLISGEGGPVHGVPPGGTEPGSGGRTPRCLPLSPRSCSRAVLSPLAGGQVLSAGAESPRGLTQVPVCELGTVTGMADRWPQCRTHLLQLPLELLPDAHCQLAPHSQVKPIVLLSLGPLQPGSQCQLDCSHPPLRARQLGPLLPPPSPGCLSTPHLGPSGPCTIHVQHVE